MQHSDFRYFLFRSSSRRKGLRRNTHRQQSATPTYLRKRWVREQFECLQDKTQVNKTRHVTARQELRGRHDCDDITKGSAYNHCGGYEFHMTKDAMSFIGSANLRMMIPQYLH